MPLNSPPYFYIQNQSFYIEESYRILGNIIRLENYKDKIENKLMRLCNSIINFYLEYNLKYHNFREFLCFLLSKYSPLKKKKRHFVFFGPKPNQNHVIRDFLPQTNAALVNR